MTCAEVQDRLWEDDGGMGVRGHLDSCEVCSSAREEIARIREMLHAPQQSTERVAAGALARMSAKQRGWSVFARYVAGFMIGVLAILAIPSDRPPASRIVVVGEAPPPPSGFQAVLSQFEAEPGFEDVLVDVLNETLRRRAWIESVAGSYEEMEVTQ